MVTLVAIACITAAFTPVISKRLKLAEVSIGSLDTCKPSRDCAHIDGYCQLCNLCSTGDECAMCTRECPDSQFVHEPTCKCVNCNDSGVGVENCLSCKWSTKEEKVICKKCPITHYLENGVCKPCPAGYSCNGVNKTAINFVNIDGVLWTARNAGDAGGAGLPTSVKVCTATTLCLRRHNSDLLGWRYH